MTRKRSLQDGRIFELARIDLAASIASLSTFSLPGIPMCPGAHMKTMVTEVAHSVWRRMCMRDTSGCEELGSEMAVSEARESEIRDRYG